MRAGSRENVSCVSCAEPVRRGQTLTSLGPRWTVTLWLRKGDGERKSGKETKVTDFRGHFHADRISAPLDCTSYWKAYDSLSEESLSLSKIKEQRLRQDLSLNIYKSLLKYKCIEREDLRKL